MLWLLSGPGLPVRFLLLQYSVLCTVESISLLYLLILIYMFYEMMYGFKPSSKIFLLTLPRQYFFYGSFVLSMSCVCHAFVSAHCCLVVTCWERADLLALVCGV